MITYEEAKQHLLKAKKEKEGRQIGGTRLARIFWEDNNAKRNICVYLWLSHWRGNRYNKQTQAEQRAEIDSDPARSYYSMKLLTLRPNGTIVIHHNRNYFYGNANKVVSLFLPEVVLKTGKLIHPKAGPKPQIRKFAEIPSPQYVPKAGSPESRARYEKNVAKYGGSLEEWHEAYSRYKKHLYSAEDRMEAWYDKNQTEIFSGVVIDSDGQALKRCVERHEANVRAAKAKIERETRKVQQENDRKRQAWLKSIASADTRKIVEALPESMQKFLRDKGLVPNNDGTVDLVKFARRVNDTTFASNYDRRFTYVVGKTAVAPNFVNNPHCGNGLHFCATQGDCRQWQRSSGVPILCRVPLDEAVVVGVVSERQKIKAKSCLVLGQLDPHGKLIGQKAEKPVEKKPVRKPAPKKRTPKKPEAPKPLEFSKEGDPTHNPVAKNLPSLKPTN